MKRYGYHRTSTKEQHLDRVLFSTLNDASFFTLNDANAA